MSKFAFFDKRNQEWLFDYYDNGNLRLKNPYGEVFDLPEEIVRAIKRHILGIK